MAAKKKALGRGLGALIEDAKYENKSEELDQKTGLNTIPLDKIELNPFQPRKDFDEDAINELATSIKELGIIQPITVRHLEDDKYQLISGERRMKASKKAGLTEVPCYIREADDQAMLEFALVENIQREDLNAIEIAISYNRLIEECKLTQESLSDRVGKKRSSVANYLRLLKLPAEIQIGIRDKLISFGHARALLNIEDPDLMNKIYFKIVNQGLSVRKTEALIRELSSPKETKNTEEIQIPEKYSHFKSSLTKSLDSKIDFKRNQNGKGRIIIPFNNDNDLERLIGIFSKLSLDS